MNSFSYLCTVMSLLWVNKFNLSLTCYAVINKVTVENTLKKKIKWLINMLHLTVTWNSSLFYEHLPRVMQTRGKLHVRVIEKKTWQYSLAQRKWKYFKLFLEGLWCLRWCRYLLNSCPSQLQLKSGHFQSNLIDLWILENHLTSLPLSLLPVLCYV